MTQRPYIRLLIRARDALLAHPKASDAEKAAACDIYKRIEVKMNSRLRTTAGRACFYQCTIEFSKCVFDNISDEEKYNTAAHEYAHLVSDKAYGVVGRDHGRRWQCIHMMMGGTGERCHSYHQATQKNAVDRYIIENDGKEYRITKRKRNQAIIELRRGQK